MHPTDNGIVWYTPKIKKLKYYGIDKYGKTILLRIIFPKRTYLTLKKFIVIKKQKSAWSVAIPAQCENLYYNTRGEIIINAKYIN